MTSIKRGRPKLKDQIKKDDILTCALDILDRDGPEGLSMRTLARRLNVTPMALYHHVTDRSALLREISDWVYSGIVQDSAEISKNSRERIADLLVSYHKAVIAHPNLTLSIFADPNAFSSEAKRITQHLKDLLAETSLSSNEEIWLDILVDYTHGSSIATAMNSRATRQKGGSEKRESEDYLKGLKELLDRIFHVQSR